MFYDVLGVVAIDEYIMYAVRKGSQPPVNYFSIGFFFHFQVIEVIEERCGMMRE